jgi:hypothetical protein
MRSRHTLLGLCALALCLGSGSARASQDEADAHFRDGSRAFDRADFKRAAEAFARADRLAPHGVAKYSAALASKAAGDRVRAHDQFVAALASGQLSAEQSSECRAQLAELDSQLARLAVRAPPGTEISVAHIERGKVPMSVRLEPGTYDLSAVLPGGHVRSRRVEARAGAEATVELEAAPAPARAAVRRAAVRRAASGPRAPAGDEAATDGATQRTVAVVALGAAGVSAAAAGLLWHRANAARDEFTGSGLRDADARGRAPDLQTATNIAWIVAGACAASGLTLWLTAPSGATATAESSRHVAVGPGVVAGRF